MRPSETDRNRSIQIARRIWATMLASPILYLLVCLFLLKTRGEATEPMGSLPTLRTVFLVGGAIEFVFASWLHRTLLTRSLRQPTTPVPAILPPFLVGWAFLEAIAILGLVLTFLGGGLIDAAPFFAAGFLGIFRMKPNEDALRMRPSMSGRTE